MKSKDVELCQALENALTSLKAVRLTTGYAAMTEGLHESGTFDIDSAINMVKHIYLVACDFVVESAEESEENTVVDDHE